MHSAVAAADDLAQEQLVMLSDGALALITIGYLGLLFAVARYGERHSGITSNPWIYTLTLGVYCTSWTFYGSIGRAAVSGYDFLAIHIGSGLALIFGGVTLRRIIEKKERYHLTSIADFIAVRYRHSQAIAALATAIGIVGIVPYIGLQLKSILGTFVLASESSGALSPQVTGLLMVVCLTVFIILFGVRKLDPTERHPGIMLALAAECLFKLLIFLAAGAFITHGLFDGID
ncbi:MAG: hypothetical protein VXZ35_10945, partial [Pseudomonadota bacterium]|nr:hypothetical protein [Pseudomonadota bacterium]